MINGLSGMGGAAGAAPGGQAPDCKSQVQGCWDAVPFMCRFIFVTCVSIYLISFGLPQILMYLVCMPQLIVYNVQIWRLLTGVFCHTQLLELLFSVMSYIPTAMKVERDMGTVRMCHRFLTLGVLINFIFCCIVVPIGLNQLSVGLWPLLFADIVCDCMKHPENSQGLCCLPIQIKSKYYPPVLLVIFSLFFGPQISLFVGLLVGYIEHFGYTSRIQLGTQTATRYESKWPFKSYIDKPYFISTGASMGGSILPSQLPRSNDSVGVPVNQAPASNNYTAFSGKSTTLATAPPPRMQSQGSAPAVQPKKSQSQQEAERKARIERFKNKHVNVNAEDGNPVEIQLGKGSKAADDNQGEYRIVDDNQDEEEHL